MSLAALWKRGYLRLIGGSIQETPLQEPHPICGLPEKHSKWVREGWPCPMCRGIEAAKKAFQKEEALADRIATLVVQRLREDNKGNPND